ncbi:cell wall-recycling L,D-carboxypeptidase ElsL [Acinetobacter sp. B51(2017)]|uniref:cell wall-recycling L,D-carboxypeptidase ElsL n=1 Tax=Acinetobacter sp. B51(2017) TaxID=2060938 RepID=UPI000F088AED|nr:cell wall-recycling L,D-carboxypeptidase ElsL [Acinetobacter sp. B51(2017)]
MQIHDADVFIDLAEQTLSLPKLGKCYVISSGKNGIGETENSGKTPRGWHKIAQKFGDDQPKNAVFKARVPTGEIYDANLAAEFPERDWILSRILWLQGLEPGFNLGEGVDTFKRYIYIHGTPETEAMGVPLSHGCIRMRNDDVVELYDLVDLNALVYISAEKICTKDSLSASFF